MVEIVVHHLLIRETDYLGSQDKFPMVSALVYMMHTRQVMMQAYQMSWFTKVLYYMDSQPWEDIKFVLKSIRRGFNLWVRP